MNRAIPMFLINYWPGLRQTHSRKPISPLQCVEQTESVMIIVVIVKITILILDWCGLLSIFLQEIKVQERSIAATNMRQQKSAYTVLQNVIIIFFLNKRGPRKDRIIISITINELIRQMRRCLNYFEVYQSNQIKYEIIKDFNPYIEAAIKRLYIMGKKENSDKPPAPKRALSAFFLYRGEVYDRVKADNPTAKITEITKIISDMWAHVDQATKDRLEAEYQKNKEAVALEKAEYEEKYGKIERKKKKKRIAKENKQE